MDVLHDLIADLFERTADPVLASFIEGLHLSGLGLSDLIEDLSLKQFLRRNSASGRLGLYQAVVDHLIDGGEARRVLTAPTDIGCYAWSPDNARIAYCAKDKKDKDKEDLAKKGFVQEIVEELVEKYGGRFEDSHVVDEDVHFNLPRSLRVLQNA